MPIIKKRSCSLQRARNNIGYIFVMPFIIGLIILFIPAVIQSVQLSFSEIIIGGPNNTYQLKNVGWTYYKQLFTVDPTFVREITESLGKLLLNTGIILIYSIFIATLLNQNIMGKGIYRAILFLPVIIATGIISKADAMNVLISNPGSAGIFQADSSTQGIFSSFDLKQLIYSMNLTGNFVNVIVNAVENVNSIITSSGVQIIIFLAGLQSISPSIYESATVEGATQWQSFWKITIPIISPLMLVNLVYTVVDAFTSYGNPVMDRIYKTIMESANYTLSSAMAIIYFLVAGVALALAMLIMNHFTFYENQ